MSYDVVFMAYAKDQYDVLLKSGKKGSLKKLQTIVQELGLDPYTGVGQPEQLRHHCPPLWSRRMDKKNRIVYQVDEVQRIVWVHSILGHYRDK